MPRCASARRHPRIRAIATCTSTCTGIAAGKSQRGHQLTKIVASTLVQTSAVRTGWTGRGRLPFFRRQNGRDQMFGAAALRRTSTTPMRRASGKTNQQDSHFASVGCRKIVHALSLLIRRLKLDAE